MLCGRDGSGKTSLQTSDIESLFIAVQRLNRVRLFVSPQTAAHQAHLSLTISWNLLKLMSIKSVMPCTHLILCHPLLLLPSIFPSIRVFSNESALHIRWPKDWSFSFSICPSNEYSGLISFRIDWLYLFNSCFLCVLSRVQLFATLWTVACQASLSMEFPGKNTGAGCHFLLQGSSQPRD